MNWPRSAAVLVLEAEPTAGYHSTGRSAALFTRNYGGPVVRRVNAASEAFFRVPPDGFCDAALLTPRGALTVAPPGAEADLDAILAFSEPGHEIVEMPAAEACARVPFLRPERVVRAVFEAGVTDIDVATLHQSYLRGARRRGAEVRTRQPVAALRRSDGHWTVTTPTDGFRAVTVVNAAGAWADLVGAMAGAIPIGLVPKRRTAIVVDAPVGTDVAALPVVDFAGTDIYLKPDAGRLMASPGDATPMGPHDAWADDMDIAVLADWIGRETRIEVARIHHSWAGLRSFVADEAPVVGFDPRAKGFFWLAGQGGYGIMMAPALAGLTAALCAGGGADFGYAPDVAPSRLVAG